ncbi:MAG: hypothetical protein PHD81_04285 [Candidatus Nanoarchaeia archaeon]|nr:hypothetical protein [Candidatus Nanoarchaeia archaeon]MDD5588299.1 hypothetical protein [Candidatus Nanoarchaeia archaeon]
MVDSLNLEGKIVSSVIKFATEQRKMYVVKGNDFQDRRVIRIEIGEYDINAERMADSFRHVIHLKNSKICDQSTMHVSDNGNIRKLYIEFIEYMNSQNVKLKNDFKEVWASSPRKYPL